MPNWKCNNCGYSFDSDAPPDTCPSCKEKCEFMVSLTPTVIAPNVSYGATTGSGIFHIYPNPVLSTATIEFHMPRPGWVRIALHDMSGRLVDVIINGYRPAGPNSVIWDSGSHPSGIYIGSLNVGAEVIRSSVIISH